MSIDGLRLMKKASSPITSVRKHMKVWKVFENANGITCQAVNFQTDDLCSFSFLSVEAYIILIVSKLPQTTYDKPLPMYFWATLQSVQSLETPNNKITNCISNLSFDEYSASLYVLKGKWAKPTVSLTSLSLAYQLQAILTRGGSFLLDMFFKGITISKNKAEKTNLYVLPDTKEQIRNVQQLLKQLKQQNFSLLKEFYIEQPQHNYSVLKFKKNQVYARLFKQIQVKTPIKEMKEQSFILPKEPEINRILTPDPPNHKQPFLLEQSQIRPHAATEQSHIKLQDFVDINDFSRELEESYVNRQKNGQLNAQFDALQEHDLHELTEIPNYADMECVQVLQNIYISGEKAAYSYEQLKKHNIGLIINVAADICINRFPGQFEYMAYFAKDIQSQNIESVFYECVEAIEERLRQKDAVLVHCVRGVSRSASIILAYIIWKRRCPYEMAEKILRAKRPQASPNTGFMLQLINFYKRMCLNYEEQPIKPKVFAISAYQKETPNKLVAKHLTEPLFNRPSNGLDEKGVFIIQLAKTIFIWKGRQSNQNQLKVAKKYVQYLQKYQKAPESVQEITQNEEPKAFWASFPSRPEQPYKNTNFLYLPQTDKYYPPGAMNPQVLVFQVGETIPLSHIKLSQNNCYLKCKETANGVKMMRWHGTKLKKQTNPDESMDDDHSERKFIELIRHLYYENWKDVDIMLYMRGDELNEETFMIEKQF